MNNTTNNQNNWPDLEEVNKILFAAGVVDKPTGIDVNKRLLPKDFGDGWMTKSAAELFRVMVAFANFDRVELIFAIHKRKLHREGLVNCRTVENAAQDLHDAWEAENKRLQKIISLEFGDPT